MIQRIDEKLDPLGLPKQGEREGLLFLMMTLNLFTLLASIWCVDEVLEPCPPFFVALAGLGEPFADAECSNRVALVLERKVGVRAPNKYSGRCEDDVELGID